MSCQVEKHRKVLSDGKRHSIIQHLKQERELKEELSIIAQYVSLNDMPLEERRKEAEKPLYLARCDDE
ncbi:MAG: hypothetical protein ABSF44_04545 [Candidatus Bathyarchaeia archaeon]|jgi:hypothetical protein